MASQAEQTHSFHHALVNFTNGWEVEKKISIGNIIAIVLLAWLVLSNWFGLGWRVQALEDRQRAQEKLVEQQTKVLAEITVKLESMSKMREDFPPHRHMEGWVVYPRGLNPEPIEEGSTGKRKKP